MTLFGISLGSDQHKTLRLRKRQLSAPALMITEGKVNKVRSADTSATAIEIPMPRQTTEYIPPRPQGPAFAVRLWDNLYSQKLNLSNDSLMDNSIQALSALKTDVQRNIRNGSSAKKLKERIFQLLNNEEDPDVQQTIYYKAMLTRASEKRLSTPIATQASDEFEETLEEEAERERLRAYAVEKLIKKENAKSLHSKTYKLVGKTLHLLNKAVKNHLIGSNRNEDERGRSRTGVSFGKDSIVSSNTSVSKKNRSSLPLSLLKKMTTSRSIIPASTSPLANQTRTAIRAN